MCKVESKERGRRGTMWQFESKEVCESLCFHSKSECAGVRKLVVWDGVCGAVSARSRRAARLILGIAFLWNFGVCSYIGGSNCRALDALAGEFNQQVAHTWIAQSRGMRGIMCKVENKERGRSGTMWQFESKEVRESLCFRSKSECAGGRKLVVWDGVCGAVSARGPSNSGHSFSLKFWCVQLYWGKQLQIARRNGRRVQSRGSSQ